MSEVLSQDEIDQLLTAIDDRPKKKIKYKHNFNQLEKLDPEAAKEMRKVIQNVIDEFNSKLEIEEASRAKEVLILKEEIKRLSQMIYDNDLFD